MNQRPASYPAPRSAWRRWLAGRTLRSRLIAGLLLLLLLASAAVGTVTTIELRSFLIGRLDQQLNGAAQFYSVSLEGQDHGGPGQPGTSPAPTGQCGPPSQGSRPADHGPNHPPTPVGQSPGTLSARFAGGQVSYACVVTDNHGSIGQAPVHLSGADVAALSRLPKDDKPYSRNLAGLGDYRLTAFSGRDSDVHVTGLPLSGVESTLWRLEKIEIVVFGAALLITAIAGPLWVRLSLIPLRRMTATASAVAELPLASGEVELPHRVPDADPRTEVGQLGSAFNRMLGHLERALTRRQASEDRLRQFAADASHELRTPLAGIRSYTELALRSPEPAPDSVTHALRRVEAESVRMSHLVDDLLLLARLDAGRPLDDQPVDLTRLVIEATNDARVAGAGHRWLLDLPDEPVTIRGDAHRLHQALANLLTNARAHTPAGTTVQVSLKPAGTAPGASAAGGKDSSRAGSGGTPMVELTVTDDGPGIPADLQPEVFGRFVRGSGGRSRAAGSTGLGLSIAHAIAAAHHGTLSLDSRPGRTVFRMTLPAGPGAAGASPAPPPGGPAARDKSARTAPPPGR
jgi:two-component system, OmpR family, sensor kinase